MLLITFGIAAVIFHGLFDHDDAPHSNSSLFFKAFLSAGIGTGVAFWVHWKYGEELLRLAG